MIGQISHEQLLEQYPEVMLYTGMNGDREYGYTEEPDPVFEVMVAQRYWVQHNDTSWTNFKTSTE